MINDNADPLKHICYVCGGYCEDREDNFIHGFRICDICQKEGKKGLVF